MSVIDPVDLLGHRRERLAQRALPDNETLTALAR